MHRSTNSLSLHFTQQVARFLRGIFGIPKIGFGTDFFSFHTATKEKKQKNIALLEQIFYVVVIGRLLIAKIFLCNLRYANTKISSVIGNSINGFFEIVRIATDEQITYKTYL